MAKNKLIDLRNHLFETLEKLNDGEIESQQAIAVSKVAQTIINTARLEMDYAEMANAHPLIEEEAAANVKLPALQ